MGVSYIWIFARHRRLRRAYLVLPTRLCAGSHVTCAARANDGGMLTEEDAWLILSQGVNPRTPPRAFRKVAALIAEKNLPT